MTKSLVLFTIASLLCSGLRAQVWQIETEPVENTQKTTDTTTPAAPKKQVTTSTTSTPADINKPFVINGRLEGATDGQRVYLTRMEGQQMIKEDSAEVYSEAFTIKGNTSDVPLLRFILANSGSHTARTDFLLEPGTISVTLNLKTSRASIDGTSNNHVYGIFKDSLTRINDNILAQHRLLRNNTLSPIERTRIHPRIDSLQQVHYDYAASYAADNAPNNVGLLLTTQYYRKWTSAQLSSVLELLEPTFGNTPAYETISKHAAQLRLTSPGSRFIEPADTLQTIEGSPTKLSDYIGQTDYTLLVFWDTGNQPSISQLIALKSVYHKYKDTRLEIVAFCLDGDTARWEPVRTRYNLTWPDITGNALTATNNYTIQAIPLNILINREGIIEERNIAPNDLRRKLDNN